MARRRGGGLILGGAILTFVGLCIVLVRSFQLPTYWVPLMVGVGLLVVGLLYRAVAGDR